MCDWRVSVNLCTLSTRTLYPSDRRAWVSLCEHCRRPQVSSLFCPSGTTRTSFLKPGYTVAPVLRIFSCRRDTPEWFWFSRTAEDTLYRCCDCRTEAQEPWRFQSTRDSRAPPQRANPFWLYFHFLNVGFKNIKQRERSKLCRGSSILSPWRNTFSYEYFMKYFLVLLSRIWETLSVT